MKQIAKWTQIASVPTVPVVGASSVPIKFSMVVLPPPDGPGIVMKSSNPKLAIVDAIQNSDATETIKDITVAKPKKTHISKQIESCES